MYISIYDLDVQCCIHVQIQLLMNLVNWCVTMYSIYRSYRWSSLSQSVSTTLVYGVQYVYMWLNSSTPFIDSDCTDFPTFKCHCQLSFICFFHVKNLFVNYKVFNWMLYFCDKYNASFTHKFYKHFEIFVKCTVKCYLHFQRNQRSTCKLLRYWTVNHPE